MSNRIKTLTNGIIRENPVLVLVLGTCPTLATSTSLLNGLGMGIAATFVLLGSNIAISLLKKVIPDKVRIPCYVVVIAGFVSVIEMLMQAYTPDLYNTLGIFIPLIVVNCIILGRAEMFANKNGVLDSALDAIGMGIGFTLALCAMGLFRELLGSGSIAGFAILPESIPPISIMGMAPGGFLTFGLLIALVNKVTKGKAIKKKEIACAGCPSRGACQNAEKGGCD
ncbi:MAG: electron transport complex subunit E [Angelakisella sp.]